MDDTEGSTKKAREWLALVHKQMINACQLEVQVIEEAKIEITNLKESFCAEIMDLKEDSHARVHWQRDELQSTRDENRWLWGEVQQAHSRIYGQGSSSQQQEEKIYQVDQARNEALAKAQFLRQALEEKKEEKHGSDGIGPQHPCRGDVGGGGLEGQTQGHRENHEDMKEHVDRSGQEVRIL